MSGRETCRNCDAEWTALQAQRDGALRNLDNADHEVNRARARLHDIETRIAEWQARTQCRDHSDHTGPR